MRQSVASFIYEYKIGLLGKRCNALLLVYDKYIEGTAAEYYSGKFQEYQFRIPLKDICHIEPKRVDGQMCLAIEYRDTQKLLGKSNSTIVFPKMPDIEHAIRVIQEQKGKVERADEEKRKQKEERDIQERQEAEEREQYCKACYDFHIADKNNPYFELFQNGLQFSCIYIDEGKNLNFLKIDGIRREESNACVPYDKIHYYEKAGNVYYMPDISGEYTSFGGSISGATFSKEAALLGGLLFGTMGMAAGALLTHEPMKFKMPTTNFHISSEQCRIDERSVILNYYSDIRKQYIDIELPAEIYNFLQTYLPEKKSDIVVELERQNIVRQLGDEDALAAPEKRALLDSGNNGVEAFETRIRKLKIMYENGIISDREFEAEKRKMLSEI